MLAYFTYLIENEMSVTRPNVKNNKECVVGCI